jgi:hypothetical protein
MTILTDVIQHFDADAWLGTLPPYQRDSIIELQGKGQSLDQITETWLGASAMTTAPFSSGSSPQPAPSFLSKLKDEIAAFLCGAERYEDERTKVLGQAKHLPTVVVSAISVAIAEYVNVTAAVLMPVVALILASLSKISLNAWCATKGYSQENKKLEKN